MFLLLQADEKGKHFLVLIQAVKLREISHSFLTDLQRMGTQGKCVEVHSAQSTLCTSPKCRLGDINYRLPGVLGQGTDFCLLEAIITVHSHSNQELGDFDKDCKDSARLKGKKNEGRV